MSRPLVFSDKNFDQKQKNDFWVYKSIKSLVVKIKFLVVVIIVGIVSNEGNIILPYFF